MSRATAALLLSAALACTGCTASPAWGTDRLRDLTDIVDVRYGTGLGLGVQADAMLLLGTGVGWSDITYSRVWYGRHSVDVGHRSFLGLVLYSAFGDYEYPGDAARTWCNVLLLNIASIGPARASGDEDWFVRDDGPPVMSRLRAGATVFLPGVHGGLYLNVGEALDFVLGLVFLDPCTDDGQPKLP